MKPVRLLYIALLLVFLSACKKKELDSDFDSIVGTWHWHQTKKTFNEEPPHTDLWANGNSTDETFKVEIERKGLIKFYKNNKLDKKYRIKDYSATYTDYSTTQYNSWVYKLYLNDDIELRLKYYVEGDSLQLWNLFPYFASVSDQERFGYINYFRRQ